MTNSKAVPMKSLRVKFTFPENLVHKPIIHDLSHEFEIVTNIRRAHIRDDMGWVVLEIQGTEEVLENGLEWAKSNGVRVDLISGDVLEG